MEKRGGGQIGTGTDGAEEYIEAETIRPEEEIVPGRVIERRKWKGTDSRKDQDRVE